MMRLSRHSLQWLLMPAVLCGVGARPTARAPVVVQGMVYDSLTRTPLASATVQFAGENDPSLHASARTNASGKFEVVLAPGRWLAGIVHARFDSLGVTLPARVLDVPPVSRFRVAMGTPSFRTIARAYCARDLSDSTGVLVGTVRNARLPGTLDSARVIALWTEFSVRARQVRHEMPTVSTYTNHDGWFVLCGVPMGAEVLLWAERGAASSGGVAMPIPAYGIARMDLAVDPQATVIAGAPDSLAASGSLGDPRPKPRVGTERLKVVVVDATGRPLPNARARVAGRLPAAVNERGTVVLDSLPAGTQTLAALALGFVPGGRTVDVEAGATRTDTVVMTSIKALLDTVRITARTLFNADVNGFERRRKSGMGHYITREEIERIRPVEFTSLVQGIPGFFVAGMGSLSKILIRNGLQMCEPAIFVDDVFQWRADEINVIARPDEIDGVEVYRRASEAPPEFMRPGYIDCGSVVVWTRWRRPKFKGPRP